MKILIAFYPIDDMGGIINHTENLAEGLMKLGHEVHTRLLVWRDQAPRSVAGGKESVSVLGMRFDQRRGYSWPSPYIIPYKGEKNIQKWLDYANTFDMIIWQVPVPTRRAENRGNMDWLGLYNSSARQVAVIHDGNFLDSYPWLYFVRRKLAGLVCVHNCAFNSGASIDVPRALIYNPFKCVPPDLSRGAWSMRAKGFLNIQTWKGWKRVPELLRAIPHMSPSTIKMVAGKGIDYYYLTSKDKCKYPGVWDAAREAGFTYAGVLTNEHRDSILKGVTCQIDASWSKKYGAIGAHFNRVTVEAIMAGCLPVVRDLGVAGSILDICPQIPWNAAPKEFAELMDHYCNLEYGNYLDRMIHLSGLLPRFDRSLVAEEIIALASGGAAAVIGELDSQVKSKACYAVKEFFNDQ